MRALADADARDAIARSLDETLIVEAAAGTGKTTALVGRILALLKSGRARLDGLVAVTFTEKAAGEMKLRLRGEIEKARHDESATADERARLDGALAELEAAHIGTIHGFCSDLLRQRPVQAKVDPLFEPADEEAQEKLFDEAFDDWFQRTLADPPEGVRRILRRRDRGTTARETLRKAGLDQLEHRDFVAPWRRDRFFDRRGAIDACILQLADLATLAATAEWTKSGVGFSIVEVARFVSELGRREAIRGRDYDGLEEDLRQLRRAWHWGYDGRGRRFSKELTREEAVARRAAVKKGLDELGAQCEADLAACLQRDLRDVVAAYEVRKARSGKLDFLDLLLVTRDLIAGDAAVRAELQRRFTHLLVDEFQDTDPLQADILLLLAADDPTERDPARARVSPGKLFVVGDPKQSIYRFRRAEVALYESIKRRLLARSGARLVHLTTSFRSAPSIQQAVNAAFAPVMTGAADGAQAEYVPLRPFRDEPAGQPTVIALPVPKPYSDKTGAVTSFAIDASTPDAVGAFVDWLVRESGWKVTDRRSGGAPVAIAPHHVCLLFKRFAGFDGDLARPYVRALEVRGVPHVLVGGRSFHAREEVLALRNALAAIEWPEDELSVFATLRGPLFALGDDALLAYRRAFGGPNPVRPIDESKLDDLLRPVADALKILKRLHWGRNRRPFADTVAQLVEATRAHAGVAIWPTGEQALANVIRVIDHARRFEAQGASSFRAFVRKLEDDAERGEAAEAPIVEEGTDGVRLMSVHKAKGLEFPVVILCDPTCATTWREPSRYVDPATNMWAARLAGCTPHDLADRREDVLRHDAAESLRVLYVAATRARELLVVPVVGDDPHKGWVDALHPALYPKNDDRRASEPAPGCPPFGEESVVDRPDNAKLGELPSVRPGLHRPKAGDHRVVWWDPNVLGLGKEEDAGVRQQRILAADEKGAAERGEQGYRAWSTRRNDALARGATPTWRVSVVTEEREGAAPVPAIDLRIEHTDASKWDRPHGTRFGVLVHAVLATVDLRAGEDDVKRAARAVGRMFNSNDEEIDAAALATIAALAHPVLAAARAGAECRREAPVTQVAEDGSMLEGVLDLAYREAGGDWVVVDFKTDAEMGSRRADYERQVAMYAAAIAAATGSRVRGVLLGV